MERSPSPRRDELPRGRPKTAQAVTVAVLVVGLLMAVFVLQNTAQAKISFLVWSARLPMAAALLFAAVLGGLLAFLVAYVRQWQFRRALRRERRTPPPSAPSLAPPSPAGRDDPDASVARRHQDE